MPSISVVSWGRQHPFREMTYNLQVGGSTRTRRFRRSALVKRLWKQRIVQLSRDETTRAVESNIAEDLEVKSVAQSMLKRLKEAQLDMLVRAVESKGADVTGCVLVPKGDLRFGRRTTAPHVLCCRLWRWPDVQQPFELKGLHWCESTNDPLYMCCNPYHWSRLCKPESPPPPYSRYPQEHFKPEDCSPCEPVSTETGGTYMYGSYFSHPIETGDVGQEYVVQHQWCTVAYWELSTRVGRLFPVHRKAVNIFSDLPQGDGMCLGTLARLTQTKNESILRTREKIGFGITISKEDEEVWVYNRSDFALFVNSPTLDPPNTKLLTVYKVLPGFSIKIFDFEKARMYQRLSVSDSTDGPTDKNAVRISFVKGWGPKYSRQVVTSCPCWLEVMFTVAR